MDGAVRTAAATPPAGTCSEWLHGICASFYNFGALCIETALLQMPICDGMIGNAIRLVGIWSESMGHGKRRPTWLPHPLAAAALITAASIIW